MKNKIISFIRLLRNSNIRISVAESIDACKALQICNISDKQQFKLSLRSTLIKQNSDIEIFNKIFELYFRKNVNDETLQEISEQEFEDLLKELEQQMSNDNFSNINNNEQNNKNDSPKEFQQNQFEEYDKQKVQKDLYKMGSESNIKEEAKKLANSRKFEKWECENINATCNRILISNNMEYIKTLAKSETRISKKNDIEKKYDLLKKYLKEQIEKNMVRQFGESIINDIIEHNNIIDKDLADLSIDELEQIKEMIKKIAKKISTHVSRKEKNGKKGKINIKKTIKYSIPYGNTACELKFNQKKKTKSELVVLCDISGSVWMYVSFMLQLTIAVQNVFDKVESYIFIDNIRNVTEEILNSVDIRNTVDNFLTDSSLGYGTDYGNVLKQFSQENIFNKKTVLIIMGDAENTGKIIGDNYLKEINEKCKAIYWLHPKDKIYWYESYSDLKDYQRYCKEIYQCSTLRQLEEFIKKLIRL